MSEQEQDFTEEQAQEMLRELSDRKESKFAFFSNVIKSKDTTKLGNLSSEELGEPQLELRGIKELELFSKKIYQDEGWGEFFHELSEIETATSLSKEGFLLRLAVTSKNEMADTTIQPKKKNSGWFRKKDKE